MPAELINSKPSTVPPCHACSSVTHPARPIHVVQSLPCPYEQLTTQPGLTLSGLAGITYPIHVLPHPVRTYQPCHILSSLALSQHASYSVYRPIQSYNVMPRQPCLITHRLSKSRLVKSRQPYSTQTEPAWTDLSMPALPKPDKLCLVFSCPPRTSQTRSVWPCLSMPALPARFAVSCITQT